MIAQKKRDVMALHPARYLATGLKDNCWCRYSSTDDVLVLEGLRN